MKNWWQTFFQPITGEIMFNTRPPGTNEKEVDRVLKEIKADSSLKILDLCCGEGRHSVILAQRGHDVVGLDYSANFLRVAKQKSNLAGTNVKFIKQDMKKASASLEKNSFDAVFSLFNSFGYFDTRKEDFQVLKEVSKVLKPGGAFVINTINGNGAKRRLAQPISMGREPLKKVFMIDSAHLDFKTMRTHARWTIVDARKAKTNIFRGSFHQNVYTHSQLKNLLKKAGFKIVKTWSQLEGGAFDEKKSWHQTILARKL